MIEVHVSLTGYSRIDFDRRKIRRALREVVRPVVRDAKRLVARKGVSAPGEYPGRGTGALFRAIRAKPSFPGTAVVIAPFRTPALMRHGAFYPAILMHGAERRRGGRLEPRENFIAAAVTRHGGEVTRRLSGVLRDALVPRR